MTPDWDTMPVGARNELRKAKEALRVGLEIHAEYLSQIGRCVSQDYARLNEFPILCAELGVTLEDG